MDLIDLMSTEIPIDVYSAVQTSISYINTSACEYKQHKNEK